MHITNISIENFKGIGKRVDIPIRPITLLFGANSAGKSTILQALLYLRHVLENKGDPLRCNINKLPVSGGFVELGGFDQFVHNQDPKKKVYIEVTVPVDDDGIPSYSDPEEGISNNARQLIDVREVSIGVTIAKIDETLCYACEYEVKINGEYFSKIKEIDSPENSSASININHPAFGPHGEEEEAPHPFLSFWKESPLSQGGEINASFISGGELFSVPKIGEHFLKRSEEARLQLDKDSLITFQELNYYFTQIFTGPAQLIYNELRGIRHIGGLRQIPPRGRKAEISRHSDNWFEGSAAWDRILREDIEDVMLDSLNRLGLNAFFEVRSFREIPEDGDISILTAFDIDDIDEITLWQASRELEKAKSIQRLVITDKSKDLELEPADVGVGVSQVYPVLIGALDRNFTILSIEQPELHIHPKIQCNLADELAHSLFYRWRGKERIDADRVLLLETHSEHLILRLLRRIREKHEEDLPPGAPEILPDDLSVLYIEKDKNGVKITHLPVTEDGDFEKKWPKGFFEERTEELF